MTLGEMVAELIQWHNAGRPAPEPTILRQCDTWEEYERLISALNGFISTTTEEQAAEYARHLFEMR